MKIWTGDLRGPLAGRQAAIWTAVLAVAMGISACGGGGSADQASGGSASGGSASGGSGSPGRGTIRVKVTDLFGDVVPAAKVDVSGLWGLISKDTDASGEVQFDEVAAERVSVCVYHLVRGTGGCAHSTVQKDRVLELSLQLKAGQMPTAAVLQATVDPSGVGADGRSLDVTVRVAVTGGRAGWSWFNGYADSTPILFPCHARTGAELAELGPRCIAGVDGRDTSYAFGEIKDAGVVRALEGERPSDAVALLIDQSDAGLSVDWAPNEPRLFAAKVFADSLLPEVPLALAAFASDTASGTASTLPQRPATFFPVEAPGFVSSRPEAFQTLNILPGMVGGGAPLYEAIVAGIEFMAGRVPPGTHPALVVLAEGTDSDCGTAAQCAQWRRTVVQRAQQADVRLFLVGDDSDTHCGWEPWNAEDLYYCETAIAAEAPLWELSALGGIPLVVGSGQGYSDNLHSQLELVRQWLSGSMTVQDISVRLTSDVEGAFAPGAVVMGGLLGTNESFCPWDCMYFALPFRVQIPDAL